MGINKFNHEGYSDPTTYEALTNIHREEDGNCQTLTIIFRIGYYFFPIFSTCFKFAVSFLLKHIISHG